MASITPRRNPPKGRKHPFETSSGKPSSASSNIKRNINLKLTIRLLPPSLTESEFLNQLATYYPHHATKIAHSYYIRGSYPLKPFEIPVYSRAYISFNSENDVNEFQNLLRGKSFFDETNDLMIPIIEKSIYHKMIDSKKGRPSSVTTKGVKGGIENNDIYLKFLAYLKHELDEFDLMKLSKSIKKKVPPDENEKRAEKSKKKQIEKGPKPKSKKGPEAVQGVVAKKDVQEKHKIQIEKVNYEPQAREQPEKNTSKGGPELVKHKKARQRRDKSKKPKPAEDLSARKPDGNRAQVNKEPAVAKDTKKPPPTAEKEIDNKLSKSIPEGEVSLKNETRNKPTRSSRRKDSERNKGGKSRESKSASSKEPPERDSKPTVKPIDQKEGSQKEAKTLRKSSHKEAESTHDKSSAGHKPPTAKKSQSRKDWLPRPRVQNKPKMENE
ncbi:uncharacterized protein J8A68_000247 [[Candida] subhashii]|uniref:UPF3 domain-containing protein n=1 Tax=[Candida] subhashii TaxID=561895 RepID=A0A8J5QXH0_9ASCO|nr:uncharacterized protein J8A68_000247 [[Candida] subhashii]KAG7666225.1 hypothetical protein J8A68_000247 [[Candida] subhashii]